MIKKLQLSKLFLLFSIFTLIVVGNVNAQTVTVSTLDDLRAKISMGGGYRDCSKWSYRCR